MRTRSPITISPRLRTCGRPVTRVNLPTLVQLRSMQTAQIASRPFDQLLKTAPGDEQYSWSGLGKSCDPPVAIIGT